MISEWALWRLSCGFTAERLYCPVCQCDTAVTERTARVVPIPEDEREP
jgi:hypothetical protein